MRRGILVKDGKQPQLVAGAGDLVGQPLHPLPGVCLGDRGQFTLVGIQCISDRAEERGAARQRPAPEFCQLFRSARGGLADVRVLVLREVASLSKGDPACPRGRG
jgi:hypothetical protein